MGMKSKDIAVKSIIRRLLTPPLTILAALLFLFEEFLWDQLAELGRRLGRLRLIARLEQWIAGLKPYPTMLLFLVPMVTLFPVKVFALYLIGTGHLLTGAAVIVTAKVGGTAIAARLFTIARPKLLSIRWFARLHDWVIATRDRLYARLRAIPAWAATIERVRHAKAWIKTQAARLRVPAGTRGLVGSRLAAIRRAWSRERPS